MTHADSSEIIGARAFAIRECERIANELNLSACVTGLIAQIVNFMESRFKAKVERVFLDSFTQQAIIDCINMLKEQCPKDFFEEPLTFSVEKTELNPLAELRTVHNMVLSLNTLLFSQVEAEVSAFMDSRSFCSVSNPEVCVNGSELSQSRLISIAFNSPEDFDSFIDFFNTDILSAQSERGLTQVSVNGNITVEQQDTTQPPTDEKAPMPLSLILGIGALIILFAGRK